MTVTLASTASLAPPPPRYTTCGNEITNPESVARRRSILLSTTVRIIAPSVVAFAVGMFSYAGMAGGIRSFLDIPALGVLSNDSSQFMQNFLTANGLLFSILCGNSFYFLYQQQESVYYALFNEVSEAKSLLEQATLVSQGRPFYKTVLEKISLYVATDLRRTDLPPAMLCGVKPKDDPLESILYLTSVGVPSVVYDTVRSLRQARAARLGALQRKIPTVQFILLYFLGFLELCSFPILGAGVGQFAGAPILQLQSVLFGLMSGAIILTLRVIQELWNPAGTAWSVDGVLATMVKGLEDELESRRKGLLNPLGPSEAPSFGEEETGAAASPPPSKPPPTTTRQKVMGLLRGRD